jgi:hypothetical protein
MTTADKKKITFLIRVNFVPNVLSSKGIATIPIITHVAKNAAM